MTSSRQDQTARDRVIDAARAASRSTIARFALDHGAQVISRPVIRGADMTVPDVEPIAGVHAAHKLELASRHLGREYIRYAREAGYSWRDIGAAMNLISGRDAEAGAESVEDSAFTFATGSPNNDSARRYGRSVVWTCTSCDQLITDYGLCNGPADDERGHDDNCPRLAATIARWDAEWEAER